MAEVLFDTLFDALADALAEGRVERKLAKVRDLAAAWQAGTLSLDATPASVPSVTERGYPSKPPLVPPNEVPQRKPTTPEGLAALFHAIVHIEWSAIDLALDHAYRFHSLPAEYYADWIAVAAEEAEHFTMLRDHLRGYGHDYGDFPAHDGLWRDRARGATRRGERGIERAPWIRRKPSVPTSSSPTGRSSRASPSARGRTRRARRSSPRR